MVKNLPAMQDTQVQSLGWEESLEEGMATHCSTLVWRIPSTEEPGRLQSMGSHGSDITEMTKQQQQRIYILWAFNLLKFVKTLFCCKVCMADFGKVLCVPTYNVNTIAVGHSSKFGNV